MVRGPYMIMAQDACWTTKFTCYMNDDIEWKQYLTFMSRGFVIVGGCLCNYAYILWCMMVVECGGWQVHTCRLRLA